MPSKKKKSTAARTRSKKRADDSGTNDALTGEPESSARTGMPAPDSIISETTFTSPKGRVYRILRTSEMDEYDEPLPPPKKRSRRR